MDSGRMETITDSLGLALSAERRLAFLLPMSKGVSSPSWKGSTVAGKTLHAPRKLATCPGSGRENTSRGGPDWSALPSNMTITLLARAQTSSTSWVTCTTVVPSSLTRSRMKLRIFSLVVTCAEGFVHEENLRLSH